MHTLFNIPDKTNRSGENIYMWKTINLFPEITRKRTFNKNTLQRLGKTLISLFGEREWRVKISLEGAIRNSSVISYMSSAYGR